MDDNCLYVGSHPEFFFFSFHFFLGQISPFFDANVFLPPKNRIFDPKNTKKFFFLWEHLMSDDIQVHFVVVFELATLFDDYSHVSTFHLLRIGVDILPFGFGTVSRGHGIVSAIIVNKLSAYLRSSCWFLSSWAVFLLVCMPCGIILRYLSCK